MFSGKASPEYMKTQKKSLLLTPRLAEKIQNDIYYNMPDQKKITLVSQFFMLAKKLKESKTIERNNSGNTTNRNK